jgi:hypothetical protein
VHQQGLVTHLPMQYKETEAEMNQKPPLHPPIAWWSVAAKATTQYKE